MSNIWTAASEGNFERVKELVEGGIHPAIPDENTYTPLHAAASWSHPDILRYLVEKGGNINTTDDDGETPLFVVESTEIAQLVIQLGGDATHRNNEGLTAAQNLDEDYPQISLYLRDITGEAAPALAATAHVVEDGPEDADQSMDAGSNNPDVDASTDHLLARVRTIMEASERGELSEQETDDRLRAVVEEAVNGQVAAGREIGEAMEDVSNHVKRAADGSNGDSKRRREEPGR